MTAKAQFEKRGCFELRAKDRKLEGYAATFGTEARIGDFVEKIAPGAFAGSLRSGRDVLAVIDHDLSRVLGRTKSGTLRLSEDTRGLAFEIDVPDTQDGRDVLALAERGDLGGMSFRFRVPTGGERWEGRNRTLTQVELVEISVIASFPAYAGTEVQARASNPQAARMRMILETLR
jgi:HK97 family phage prohead protease